jgi:hypothetical protein
LLSVALRRAFALGGGPFAAWAGFSRFPEWPVSIDNSVIAFFWINIVNRLK